MTNEAQFLAAPPPSSWAMELYAEHGGAAEQGYEPQGSCISSTQDAYDAWKHCKDVTRDEGRVPDLFEMLQNGAFRLVVAGVGVVGVSKSVPWQLARLRCSALLGVLGPSSLVDDACLTGLS